MSLTDMSPEVLTPFLLKESLIDKAQVEKFHLQDIDGETLLGMSASELMSHLGFTFGKATRLMKWLKIRTEVASLVAISTQPVYSQSETKEVALEQVPLVVKKPSSSSSGQRGRLRHKLSNLPPDPVTDIDDLKLRVFQKKPADEYTNMWGKGYLESYHPRAHAIHNKNVERMRGFFADVYNPIVAQAWSSTFKGNKTSYDETLQFIESCLPQIEPLVLIIRGVSMSIQWTAKDIMRGWFLDHKKHSIRNQRLEQIRAIEIDNRAFLGSIPTAPSDVDKFSDDKGEKKMFSNGEDFSEASENLGIYQPWGLGGFQSFTEGSHCSNGSMPTNHQRVELSPVISAGQEANNQHKKTLLVVGEEYCKTKIERGGSKEVFTEDQSSIGDTEIIQDDEQDIEFDSASDLHTMPCLKRKTTDSSISNTSTDAHSPNLSITSTETDDSIKLKHPKKYLLDIYDEQVGEIPTATRSELPKGSLAHGAKGFPQRLNFADISNLPQVQDAELTTDTKIAKLKSIRSSKNNTKENTLPSASVFPFNKGKLQQLASTTLQAPEIDALTEDSKLTIAYKAMKLPSKKEVGPQLKSFMATQNRRVQVFNEHASSTNRKALPFSGHANMATSALLDLLVKWALEFRVNIVNAPKPINGKVRLFSQHIEDK